MPALRTLTRSPGFTLAVVLTLALGIASTTAVFSVFNAVLLRPFPYPSPDRIVALQQADKHEATSSPTISYPDYVDLVTQSGAFTRATVSAGWFPSLSGAGDAEILNGSIVDSPFFDVFGVKPERGRFFTVQEDKPGLDDKVVISHGLWKRKFGGADVVGRPLRVDGRSLTIIGIVPATFEDPHLTYGHDADVWTTIAPKFDGDWTRSGRSLRAVARLRAGISVAEANARVRAIAARLRLAYPKDNANEEYGIVTLRQARLGGVRRAMVLVLCGSAPVLLL